MPDSGIRLPLEIFAGVRPPEHWARIESSSEPHAAKLDAHRRGRVWARPALGNDAIRWAELGALPRFVGSETTSCVAALQPSIFHNDGADEFERFAQATARRGETALIVSTIGDPSGETFRNVFNPFDDSVSLPGSRGSICGRRLPASDDVDIAQGLDQADRDFALRLRDGVRVRWALELQASEWDGPKGREVHDPGGRFDPLLVNSLGEAVAGVWIPGDDRNWRWYVVPGGTLWEVVIAWIVDRGVPTYVPTALHRIRAGELVDDDLLTGDELIAREALASFEREVDRGRHRLLDAVTAATEASARIRHDLLYGTGDALKDVVAHVLKGFGFEVEDLDATFGSGKSADLLASRDGAHCLVEVKSAGGMPGEGLVADLERHARTWPSLGRTETLHRTILVVGHQTSQPPTTRTTAVYGRPEFIDSLQHAVVPALTLFSWWRDGRQHEAIDAFVEGPVRCHPADLSRTSPADGTEQLAAQSPAPPTDVTSSPSTPWWKPRRG